jgi:hypothetical protein
MRSQLAIQAPQVPANRFYADEEALRDLTVLQTFSQQTLDFDFAWCESAFYPVQQVLDNSRNRFAIHPQFAGQNRPYRAARCFRTRIPVENPGATHTNETFRRGGVVILNLNQYPNRPSAVHRLPKPFNIHLFYEASVYNKDVGPLTTAPRQHFRGKSVAFGGDQTAANERKFPITPFGAEISTKQDSCGLRHYVLISWVWQEDANLMALSSSRAQKPAARYLALGAILSVDLSFFKGGNL